MTLKKTYAENANLTLFPATEFESTDNKNDLTIAIRNGLRLLFTGWNKRWKEIMNTRLLKAALWKRDPEALAITREQLHEAFLHIHSQLQEGNFQDKKLKHIHLYLANLISLLPLLDPTPFETFKIPQQLGDDWKLVDYKVVPIELTSPPVSKYLMTDEQRVFAYGLEPINQDNAVSHLIFPSTNCPAGQGFGEEAVTDLMPFTTVGETLYKSAKPRINKWMNEQVERPIHVSGGSLGGALSLLLATDQPEKIQRVDAFNPPGLFAFHEKKKIDHWKQATKRPEVYIQSQENDGVSQLGFFKPEWTFIHVKPDKKYAGPSSIAHGIQYIGQPGAMFYQIDTTEENNKVARKLRNVFIYGIARTLGFVFIVAPWVFIIRPIANFISLAILKHKPINIHSPEARNPSGSLDIANATQEKTISLNDLGIYFHAQRSLFQKKEWATPEKNMKTSIQFQGKNKAQVLLDIETNAHETDKLKETITIQATNAKLYHIEKTLRVAKANGITFFEQTRFKPKDEYVAAAKSIKDEYSELKLPSA